MSKTKYFTKRLPYSIIEVMGIDKDTHEVRTITFEFKDKFFPYSVRESTILKACNKELEKQGIAEKYKLVQVTKKDIGKALFGIPMELFLENKVKLDETTKQPI